MNKKKKIIIIVSVILVLAIGITLCATLLPDRLQGSLPEDKIYGFTDKPEDAIRVMSFNVRCTNVGARSMKDRVPDVVTTILKGMPDSMGVQEATPEWMETLDKELASHYDWVGEGRDGNGEGEFSAIFYLKEKYELVDSGTFWLSETPDKVSMGWDAGCRRVCTWAILRDKDSGAKYVHLNSHFDHVGKEARSHSVKMILEKAKEFENLPIVFTADMNVKEGSDNYKEFADSDIFDDTKYLAENVYDYITYHDRFPEKHEGWIIDYCFINEGFEAITYGVVTESPSKYYVSDHFPVYADLRLEKNFNFDLTIGAFDASISLDDGIDIDIDLGKDD